MAPPGSEYWANIQILDLRSGERRSLVEGGAQPHYVDPGYIVYHREGTLFAAPFDVDTLSIESGNVAA